MVLKNECLKQVFSRISYKEDLNSNHVKSEFVIKKYQVFIITAVPAMVSIMSIELGVIAIIASILTVMFNKSLMNFGNNLLKLTKKNRYAGKSFEEIKEEIKPSSSVATNIHAFRNIVKTLNPQPPRYTETLYCGCKSKEKVIVEFCEMDRNRRITFTYTAPKGYCITDDTI